MAERGRPTIRTPEVEEEIVAWISEGKTLREFCRQEGKPARRTVDEWRLNDPEFSARVTRARDEGFGQIAEECMEIADDASNDWMQRIGKDGEETGWQLNGDHVQRSKLRIETRLKLLACWDPRRYGNKVQVGGDGGEPINVTNKGDAVKELASILATAAARKS